MRHDQKSTLAALLVSGLTFGLLGSAGLARAQDRKVEDAVAKAVRDIDAGKREEALARAGKLAEASSPESQLGAARIQAHAGKHDLAAKTAQRALSAAAAPEIRARVLAHLSELDVLGGTARDAVARAREAVHLQPTADTLAVLAHAQAHAKDPQAVTTAEKAAGLAADSARVQEALGHALTSAGKYAEAEAALAKALQLDPKRHSTHVHRAFLFLEQGKAADAEAAAREATTLAPQHGLGFAVLGAAILAKDPKDPKIVEAAVYESQQAGFLSPHSAYVQFVVGSIFEKMGSRSQATTAYQKAAEIDPGFTPARVALVKAEYFAGNIDGALTQARALAEDNPGDGEAQLLHGRILLRKEAWADALAPLERAAELLPAQPDIPALLGTAFQLTQQYAAAVDYFQRAIALSPGNIGYRLAYATSLMQAKRFGDAVTTLQEALQRDSTNTAAMLGLGTAHVYAKQYDAAVTVLARAAETDANVAAGAHLLTAWAHLEHAEETKRKELADASEAVLKKSIASGMSATDPRVVRLQAAIDRFRKGAATPTPTPEPTGPTLAAVAEGLKSPDAGMRIRNTRLCVQFGADCVPYLHPMLRRDPDLAVRENAARALGAIGPPAAAACADLLKEISDSAERMILPPDSSKRLTPEEEARLFGREQRLQNACRDARQRIGCK